MGRKKDADGQKAAYGPKKKKSQKGTFRGGSWDRNPKKEKLRPGAPREAKKGANVEPSSDDEDVMKVPTFAGRSIAPNVENDAPQPAEEWKSNAKLRREEKLKKSKDKAKRGAKDGKPEPDWLKAPGREPPKVAEEKRPDLPKQLPGESKWAYFARLDKACTEKLRQHQKKVVSVNVRDKKKSVRKLDKEYKEKRIREQNLDDTDGLFVAGDKAEHLDDVERPPQFSGQAKRSVGKMKKAKTGGDEPICILPNAPKKAGALDLSNHGAMGTKAKLRGGNDLADYASKVRMAYAAMKKQRLEAHQ